MSLSILFSLGRQHLLLTNYQCRIWISFLELEALVNRWWYAKHVSYIRVTICLCAAINLRLDVDCSLFALSYPSYCPPTLTSCCNNGYWPPHRWLSAKRGQQKGPVDPYTLPYIQWQTPTHTELWVSESVLVNDKLQPKTTGSRVTLLRDSWDLSQGDPVPSCLPFYLSPLLFPLLSCTSSCIHTDKSTGFKVQLQ